MDKKAKLLYLIDILKSKSDEEHPLNTKELINELLLYGIEAERKSIYRDIQCLCDYGYDIIHSGGKNGGYYLASREFELAELKLLVDAVQASKFITARKSQQLIRKLESFAGRYDAGQLNRQVYVSNRVKTMNESIYYNVDKLHRSMNNNHEITFKYFEWTCKKEKKLRHDGKLYRVSPWSLCWDDENYYLVSYDADAGCIKHFRVDKMLDISEQDSLRQGKEIFAEFDSAIYSKQVFGMFSGEPEPVRLRSDNKFAGVFIDRFGNDITMLPVSEDEFEVTVKVAVSPPFFSWVFQMGGKVKILSPGTVADSYRRMLEEALKACE